MYFNPSAIENNNRQIIQSIIIIGVNKLQIEDYFKKENKHFSPQILFAYPDKKESISTTILDVRLIYYIHISLI